MPDNGFERCWFGMFPEMTFLNYLIEWDMLDEVLEAWDSIIDSEENIKITREELLSGNIKSWRGDTYTWKDLVNGDGTPSYSSREEWEAEQRDYIEQEQELIDGCRETISGCWNDYIEQKKSYKNGSLDEEMKRVLEWREAYQKFLESGEPEGETAHENDTTGV